VLRVVNYITRHRYCYSDKNQLWDIQILSTRVQVTYARKSVEHFLSILFFFSFLFFFYKLKALKLDKKFISVFSSYFSLLSPLTHSDHCGPKPNVSWIYNFVRSHLVGFFEREMDPSDGLSTQNNTDTKETWTHTRPSGTRTHHISFRGSKHVTPHTARGH
jgi:hypothetical protein